MFFKLALKNVAKSMRDYAVYFLTMTFGVCLFYMFNSIGSQSAMMQLSESQYDSIEMLSEAISYVSVFISVILGFLIVYANQFLIKRRKKELGVYMTLGMEKGKISRILIVETFLIGIFALAVGLGIGVFASQGLSVLTAKMFEANLKSFYFTFALDAFYKTLLYFGIIFLIVMIFNTLSISKLKLIDLLTAGKKNENLRIKKLWISVLLFILSVICLAAAYYFIIKNGMLSFNMEFTSSIVLGCIGTLLFFLSLSGFLLRIIQTNKRIYFKNMNMFVLRQINSKINTTFLSMSVICIMLLITIGTLSTGMGLSNVLTKTLKESIPYDASFTNFNDANPIKDMAAKMQEDKIDFNRFVKEHAQLNVYYSNVTFDDLIIDDSLLPKQMTDQTDFKKNSVDIISLTDYNNAMKLQGKPAVALKPNEFLMNCSFDKLKPVFKSFLKSGRKIKLGGQELTCIDKTVQESPLSSSMFSQSYGALIVPDSLVRGLQCMNQILNVNYKPGISEKDFLEQLKTVYNKEALNSGKVLPTYFVYETRIESYEKSIGMSTMVSYLAIYIGLVFLITSAAVLALQQLSEASDNTERYGLLKKLGAEESMVNHALFTQIAIYFFIPLSLAIIHSIVGIHVANTAVSFIGGVNILGNTMVTAAIFLVIYGGYFLATYFGSKSMIRQKQN
jgi:putative ABC transport system permease protein